jgi:hypothetical protein
MHAAKLAHVRCEVDHSLERGSGIRDFAATTSFQQTPSGTQPGGNGKPGVLGEPSWS